MPFLTRQPIFYIVESESNFENSNSEEVLQKQPIYVEKMKKIVKLL